MFWKNLSKFWIFSLLFDLLFKYFLVLVLKNGFIMKKSDSGHCFETLLPNFKHFFDRSELTDLTVTCEDGSVQTFRLLLASVSEYLKGTWTGCQIVLFVPNYPPVRHKLTFMVLNFFCRCLGYNFWLPELGSRCLQWFGCLVNLSHIWGCKVSVKL